MNLDQLERIGNESKLKENESINQLEIILTKENCNEIFEKLKKVNFNIEDKDFDIKYATRIYTLGGCEYNYRKLGYLREWSTIVLGLYNIWNNRREEEIHGKE